MLAMAQSGTEGGGDVWELLCSIKLGKQVIGVPALGCYPGVWGIGIAHPG